MVVLWDGELDSAPSPELYCRDCTLIQLDKARRDDCARLGRGRPVRASIRAGERADKASVDVGNARLEAAVISCDGCEQGGDWRGSISSD